MSKAEKIKFSVVINTYERVNLLKRAIESVLAQTHEAFEILVIDDGSKIKCDDVIESYAKDNLFYFHKPNSGLPDSRNYGVKRCKGDYVAFLDDDDVFLPEKLSKVAEYLETSKVDVVSHDALIGEDYEPTKEYPKFYKMKNERNSIWSGPYPEDNFANSFDKFKTIFCGVVLPSASVFKISTFRDLSGYSTKVKNGEDIEFVLRHHFAKSSFAFIPTPLSFYTMAANSMSRSGRKTLINSLPLYHRIDEFDLSKQERATLNATWAHALFSIGYSYLQERNYSKAIDYNFQTLKKGHPKLFFKGMLSLIKRIVT